MSTSSVNMASKKHNARRPGWLAKAKKERHVKVEQTTRHENGTKRKRDDRDDFVRIDIKELRHLMNAKRAEYVVRPPWRRPEFRKKMKVEPVIDYGIARKRTLLGGYRGKKDPANRYTTAVRRRGELEEVDDNYDGKDEDLEEISSKKHEKRKVEVETAESYKFRDEVLSFLAKPFDKGEYRMYRALINAGSYLKHHSDLKSKLKEYRYQRGKCLVLLRGYFFWLQNLPREGSFEPWNDLECVAVKPPQASSKF